MSVVNFLAQQGMIAGVVYELATTEPDFAPNYYDYPEALGKLLKATARLELALKRFNKEQAEALALRVDLSNIHQIKLDQFDKLGIFIDFMWDEDAMDLASIFTTHLPDAIAAGGLMTQLELGITIDFSPADLPAQKFLERHIPRLARDVTDTTRERVKNSIRQGLLAGKDRTALAKDLADVFDNPTRRRMIAQTESVQAFSEGRIQAGIQMGSTHKRWRAQIQRCPICAGLHGEKVGLTDSFSGGYFSAPAHPNCRCGIELSFGDNPDTANIEQHDWDYIKGLRTRFP